MHSKTYRHILIALCAIGMASCHSHSDSPEPAKPVALLSPVPSWAATEPASGQGSRALSREGEDWFDVEDGKRFYPFADLYPTPINPDFTTIGIFMARENVESYTSPHGAFRFRSGNKWDTTVQVEEQDYFIFGFMPATLTPDTRMSMTRRDDSDTWADGAKITVTNFPAVTGADVSAVIGVLKATDPDVPINDPEVVPQLKQGVYAYKGTETDNYVYLLLDHLYTNVNFEIYTDYDYSQLRRVRLKMVEMISEVAKNVTMTYEVTNDPLRTVNMLEVSSVGEYDPQNPAYAMLFPVGVPTYLDVEPQVEDPDNQKYTSVPGYFVPASNDQVFTFVFTYDVFDTHGNIIRSDCKASCRWDLAEVTTNVSVANGVSYRVKVCVKPTYLYQLGEEDVDFVIDFTGA